MRPDVDISTTSNRDCQNLFAEMYLHTRLSRILLPRSFASALERRTVNIISHLRAETQTKLSALASDLPTLKVNLFYATPKAFPDAIRGTGAIPFVSMDFADPINAVSEFNAAATSRSRTRRLPLQRLRRREYRCSRKKTGAPEGAKRQPITPGPFAGKQARMSILPPTAIQ